MHVWVRSIVQEEPLTHGEMVRAAYAAVQLEASMHKVVQKPICKTSQTSVREVEYKVVQPNREEASGHKVPQASQHEMVGALVHGMAAAAYSWARLCLPMSLSERWRGGQWMGLHQRLSKATRMLCSKLLVKIRWLG